MSESTEQEFTPEQERQAAEAAFADVQGEPTDKAQAAPAAGAAPEKSDAELAAEAKAVEATAAKARADTDAAAAQVADKAAYDALPKALRERVEKLEKLPVTVEKLASHMGGLINATSRIEVALKTAKTAVAGAGGDTPSDKQVQAAMSNPEAWARLKEDFPDWAGPVEAEFAALRAEMAKQTKTPAVDVDGLRREFAARSQRAGEEAEEKAFIRMKHPDWKTTVNTPEFKAWTLQGGPSAESYAQYKAIEATDPAKADSVVNGFAREFPQWWADRGAAMFGSTADHALKLLDGFSEHGKSDATRQKRHQRLESAVPARGTASPIHQTTSEREAAEKAFASA